MLLALIMSASRGSVAKYVMYFKSRIYCNGSVTEYTNLYMYSATLILGLKDTCLGMNWIHWNFLLFSYIYTSNLGDFTFTLLRSSQATHLSAVKILLLFPFNATHLGALGFVLIRSPNVTHPGALGILSLFFVQYNMWPQLKNYLYKLQIFNKNSYEKHIY